MDIKKEPEDVQEHLPQNEVLMDYVIMKYAETIRPIKSEDTTLPSDSHHEESTYLQITSTVESKPTMISRSYTSKDLVGNFNLQIDEMNLKTELKKYIRYHQEVDGCIVNSNMSSPYPEKIATIKLKNCNFYKRNFICNVCYEFFPSSEDQYVHKLDHKQTTFNITSGYCNTGKIEYDKLNNEYEYVVERKKHKITHSGEKSYKCDECNRMYTYRHQLKLHKMTHSGEKPYKCDKCKYNFITKSNLKRHQMTHSDENPIKCNKCYYLCTSYCELKRHKITHSGEKSYKCDECDRKYTYKSQLKQHKMTHSGERPHKCDECKYAFMTKRGLKLHKMTHSDENPFKCNKCYYMCTSYFKLQRHKITHSGEKSFRCDECNFMCAYKCLLKSHKMTHSGTKPHKCNECKHAFISKQTLKFHKMTHSGEKPFKCDECNHASIRKCDLRRHKMNHSSEKPYKCDQCKYVCASSSQLKTHKMNHSSNKPHGSDYGMMKYAETIRQIKSEDTTLSSDSRNEETTYLQITSTVESKPTMTNRSYTSKDLVGNFNLQIDEMNLKTELKKYTRYDQEAVSCIVNSNMSSRYPEKIATIKLKKINFYKRNFICNVCYEFFPSSEDQYVHKLDHKQTTFNITGGYCTTSKIEYDKLNNEYECVFERKNHKITHSGEKSYKCDE